MGFLPFQKRMLQVTVSPRGGGYFIAHCQRMARWRNLTWPTSLAPSRDEGPEISFSKLNCESLPFTSLHQLSRCDSLYGESLAVLAHAPSVAAASVLPAAAAAQRKAWNARIPPSQLCRLRSQVPLAALSSVIQLTMLCFLFRYPHSSPRLKHMACSSTLRNILPILQTILQRAQNSWLI